MYIKTNPRTNKTGVVYKLLITLNNYHIIVESCENIVIILPESILFLILVHILNILL